MKPIDEILTNALELRTQLLEHELRLKEQFLSLVSHELRSPLTAIYQFTTIILDGLAGDVSEQQRQYLEICLRNIHQLQKMINDLLTATRARSGALGVQADRMSMPLAITEALDALSEPAEEKGVALAWSAEHRLPAAFADEALIGQVLIHLIHNGIKFTPAGGRVHVRAKVAEENPDLLQIEVEDTGCGLPEDLADRLFERLNQPVVDPDLGGRRGLGLSLFIAKDLVERQGGTIWAESETGKGSTFTFTVPVFSLVRLITPLVVNTKRRKDSLELLTIALDACGERPGGNALLPRCRVARRVLRKRLVPGLEILLPEQDVRHGQPEIHVIAAVEENSGQCAVDRMNEHLTRSKRLLQLGLSFTTSSAPIEPMETEPGQTEKERLEQIASQIERLLHESPVLRAGNV